MRKGSRRKNLGQGSAQMENLERRRLLTAAATSVSIYSPELITELGQEITLSAMITAVRGSPTGTVSFDDGSTVLGTVPVDPKTDHAIFDIDTLSAGTHKIEAVYSGSSLFAPSKSPVLKETVDGLAVTTPSLSFTGGTTILGGVNMTIGGEGEITNNSGTLIINGSDSFSGSEPILISGGGTLSFGSINSNPPILSETGGIVLIQSTGTFQGSTTPADGAQGGTLLVSFLGGTTNYNPVDFSSVGGTLSLTNTNGGVTGDVVRLPEPTAIGALAIAGAGLLVRRKENKRRKSEIGTNG